MTAFLLRMPAGIPGAITRPLETTAEPALLVPSTGTLPITVYGAAAYYDQTAKRYRLPTTGDTPAQVTFLMRPFPGGNAQFNPAVGTSAPVNSTHVADVMKRGYMNVLLRAGTATKNGTVYVRIAAGTTNQPIGGVEAVVDATPSNQLVLPNVFFTGAAFTDSTFGAVTEIAVNI